MNERERRFCEEYLIDLSPQNAALRAGYAPATARNAACWIAPGRPKKPELRGEIDRMLAERSRRTGVNADRVVRELARIAFADVADVMDAGGTDVRGDIARDDSAALAQVRRRETAGGVECEIRMHDKNRALQLLGKHLGLFADGARSQPAPPVIIDVSEEAPKDAP